MTTKVTVDAHAGWPVEVATVDIGSDGSTHQTVDVVQPHTTKDFYIHSSRELRWIKELPLKQDA